MQGNKLIFEDVNYSPIGIVKNAIDEPVYIEYGNLLSDVIIKEEFQPALDQLDAYSHLVIVYHMDQICLHKQQHVPQGKYQEVPEVGIFACRCPWRPNPIAVTTVKLMKIDGNVITVKGLDAANKSPVLDVKPYYPPYDKIGDQEDIRVPEWIYKLTY